MRSLWLAAIFIPLVACTSTDDMNLLHREITDVQRQIQSLETSTLDKNDLKAMEKQFETLTSNTVRSNADLAMRVEGLQEQIEALHASLELTTRRLQSISQELAATRMNLTRPQLPPVVAAPQPGGATDPSAIDPATGNPISSEQLPVTSNVPTSSNPEELYRSAYEDYLRGNYELAAQGFTEYMNRWSETDLTDNALYWVGECYDAQDMNQEALETFTTLLEKYPASDKAAAAQLKKGLLYLKLGDQGQGVVHLQYVVYEHPSTQEADLARERLRSLGLTIR